MIIVDLNLLIYATNASAPQHARALAWWKKQLSGSEPIGLPWTVLLGFLRLCTNPKAMPRPLTIQQASSAVDAWLLHQVVRPVEPTERHWEILKELLSSLGTAGNLTTDAHLAALAIEHGARLYSTDNDFDRFPKLRWINPLTRR